MNRQPELFGGAFRYASVERKRIRDRPGRDRDGIVVRGRFDFSRDRDRVAIRNERHIRRLARTAAVHVEFERVAVDRNRAHRRLKIFARIGGIPVRIDLRPEQRAGIDRNAALDAVNAERTQAPDARAQVARAQRRIARSGHPEVARKRSAGRKRVRREDRVKSKSRAEIVQARSPRFKSFCVEAGVTARSARSRKIGFPPASSTARL